MYGIPNMKLEKQIIDRKINIMKEEGVTFVTGIDIGKDIKASKLLHDLTVSYWHVVLPTPETSMLPAEMPRESISRWIS